MASRKRGAKGRKIGGRPKEKARFMGKEKDRGKGEEDMEKESKGQRRESSGLRGEDDW